MSGYDFKKEEDVKEFVENLGIEYRFGCYKEKKSEVCHLLGDYLEAIKSDFERASKVYTLACNKYNYPKSCTQIGYYHLYGKGGVDENHDVAFNYFRKGCDFGEFISCYNAGIMVLGAGDTYKLKPNNKLGLKFLERACTGNNVDACSRLSLIYLHALHGVQRIDFTKAHKFGVKACELGDMVACANVSRMYNLGDGVEQDSKLAEKYKRIALDIERQTTSSSGEIKFQLGVNS